MGLVFRFSLFVCLALAIGGCGRSATYRYKLTVSLDTPDGVKSGFNVVDERYFEVRIPDRGEMHETSGQGIYIDLGPGRRPLVVLLGHARQPHQRLEDIAWGEDNPSGIFLRRCLRLGANATRIDMANAILGCNAPFEISGSDMPDLVTFSDVSQPETVLKVDPANLGETLGPGVSWRSMTLQATDEPLTTGIEKHLPWVTNYDKVMYLAGLERFNGLPLTISRRDLIRKR